MFPPKKVKSQGNSGKEPKLHYNGEKNLGRTHGSVGG